MPLKDFHLLEQPLTDALPGLKIVNRPPADEGGSFTGQRFFTLLYIGQYFCLEQEKEDVELKIYLRHSPFTKQRAAETIMIAESPAELTETDIHTIIETIREAPRFRKPLRGNPIQHIYGHTGLHPLGGYLMQLSKAFIDALGEKETYILNELDYIENPVTTIQEKILVFHGKDGEFFTFKLPDMKVIT